MRFLYFSAAIMAFLLAEQAEAVRLNTEVAALDEPINTAEIFNKGEDKQKAQAKRAHDLRDDLEAEMKMNFSKDGVELARKLSSKMNDYKDLLGSSAEMKKLDGAVAMWILAAKKVPANELNKNENV